MTLVENWKSLHRSFSVWAMGFSTIFLQVWALMPDDLKTQLPPWVGPPLASGILVLGIIGRYVKQPKVSDAATPGDA